MKQQFHRGDLIRTLPILWNGYVKGVINPKDVRHVPFYGIILGSYRDRYGGGKQEQHTYSVLQLKEDGTADYSWSWLDDEEIEYLVEPRCIEHLDFIDTYLESR